MKKTVLIIGLIFCSMALGDDPQPPQPPQPPAAPATNQPTPAAQTNPNITIAPSEKDVETADKLFKDATYDNFAPEPEHPFIDSDNLNNPSTAESD